MFVKLKFVLIFVFSIPVFSQVGINTTSPTASLDVNGDLRIRTIEEETNPLTKSIIAKDSVLVTSGEIVKSIPSKEIINSVLLSAVKGGFSGPAASSITLGSLYEDLVFDSEEFDLNDEFNVSTGVFTAKQDGIYQVTVQINSSSAIAVSTDYGVCILKNNALVARENFANISLLGLNLTPPIRKTQALLQLSANDTISFQIFSNLLSVNLLSNSIDTFFTIVQIR